jgi:hypothetical protein
MLTKNVGREPALKVTFSDGLKSGFMPRISDLPQLPIVDVCHKDASKFGSVIFPGQSYSYERIIYPDKPSPDVTEMIKAVIDGTMVFYFQDCAVYTTFDEVHRSPFCFYLTRTIAGKLMTYHCPKGNDAD